MNMERPAIVEMLGVSGHDYYDLWDVKRYIEHLEQENARLHKLAYLTIPKPKWLRWRTK